MLLRMRRVPSILFAALALAGCPRDPDRDAPAASAAAPSSAAPSATAPDPIGRVAVRRELELWLGDQRVGSVVVARAPQPDGSLNEDSTMTFEVKVQGEARASRKMTRFFRTSYGPDLAVRAVAAEDREDEVVEKFAWRVEGKALSVVYDQTAHHEEKTLALPEGWGGSLVVWADLEARAARGESLPIEGRYVEFDEDDRAFVGHKVTLLERTTVALGGDPIPAFRIEDLDDKGSRIKTVIDREGMPFSFEIGAFRAKLPGAAPPVSDHPPEIQRELLISGKIPATPSARDKLAVDVVVAGDAGVEPPIFLAGPYQEVTRDGDTYHLVLKPRRATPGVKAPPLPMAGLDAEVARYLAATAASQSDDPAIAAKAREIVAGEKDSRKAAQKIVRWVFEKLDKADGVRGAASAVETLRAMRGDCSEHAALVVALARAAGIPARGASGIVMVPEPPKGGASAARGGYHAWPELWLGEWVVLDAALGQLEVGPHYVFVQYDEPGGRNPGDLRLMNGTRLSILERQPGAGPP